MAKNGAVMVSCADVSLHGVQGGKGSAWILLPAGSTSFPLHYSLNAAPDFKDIGSTVTARPRNSTYCFTAT